MKRESIMFRLGGPEIAIILVIVVLLFGPSRLPKLGKSVGETIKAVRGWKRELNDASAEVKDDLHSIKKDLTL
jgi:sec-independent protein translocase protein TatA